MDTIYSALIPEATPTLRETIANTLEKFGPGVLKFAHKQGIRIVPMTENQLYRDASPTIKRMGVTVDSWASVPAGLFVVEERAVYIRTQSEMTVAHEFGHALDCALGGGIYRSGLDPVIRKAFANDTSFVTPYACTSLDEFFAENVRAYVEINAPMSVWPRVSKAKLLKCSPTMHAYLSDVFERLNS